MAEQADIIGAVRQFMLGITDLAALLDNRIFAVELPASEAGHMPRKALVIRPAGGPERQDYREFTQQRYDLLCYGETAFEADRVRRTAWPDMQQLTGETLQGVRLYSVMPSGSTFFRDLDNTDWPVFVDTYLITAATCAAA